MNYLVDTHMHIYKNYDVELMLNSALSHFKKHQKQLKDDHIHRVLLLTETNNDNAFDQLSELVENSSWGIESSEGDVIKSLIRKDNVHSRIWLIAGQQVISKENIEVSIWFSKNKTLEILPAKDIIFAAIEDNAVCALPWGVAKWFGDRGKVIDKLMDHYRDEIILTDNSGRPNFWPQPSHFLRARKHNIPVLAGSDILPLANSEVNAARYLSYISCDLKPYEDSNTDADHAQHIVMQIKSLLTSLKQDSFKNIGKRANMVEFFNHQSQMQWRKRQ